MTSPEAHNLARALSKRHGIQYLVYDKATGFDAYDAGQMHLWGPFVTVMAIYVNGCEVANTVRAAA